ncbi:MAG: hypothetical protein ACR2QT_09725 [Woeseiaceae bacterium]
MAAVTIQDWTETTVLLKYEDQRAVRYRVYRDSEGVFQEITEPDGSPIHELEIPDGMKLDKTSYEVMLRYVLLDILAA